MTTRLEGAYKTVEIAQRKEVEGDFRRAHMAYETAIRDFMHLSFLECSNRDELKRWLSNHPLELAADRFCAITTDICQMPKPEWNRYFQSGNYLLVAFSHFFAALEQHQRAYFFAQTAAEPTLFQTPFWAEYAKTLWAMIGGRSYAPVFGKLKRIERFWSCYVDLMQAAMRRVGVDDALAEVDRQFTIRNSDMSLREDPYMIDGTGEFPLSFDFRKAGLMETMANIKLRIVI